MAIRQQDGNLIGKKLTQEIKDKYRDARIYKNDTVTCDIQMDSIIESVFYG